MLLHHEMTVPAATDDVWRALGDIEEVAPCLPGAAVDLVDDETVYGSMTVRVGPITVAYKGHAVIDERDDAHHRMVVHATGREQRGVGTARATMVVAVLDRGAETELDVDTDLTITGRPAQFGRGMMTDIGDRVIAEFADRLARQLTARTAGPPGSAAGATADVGDAARADPAAASRPGGEAASPSDGGATAHAGSTAISTNAPLDLGPVLLPMLRRAALLAAIALALTLVQRRLRRRISRG